MALSAYSLLLILTLLIFLFCYFIATRVWIRVDKKNIEQLAGKKIDSRRDFLHLTTISIGGIGTAAFIWPFLKSMNPAEDTLALGSTEVDISEIGVGEAITVKWRGKPIFIRHRTSSEINEANTTSMDELKHMATDESRVKDPKWLIVVGVCTHLGCVPLGQKIGDNKGEFGGWFCPCHGSHYDTSGRIRKGPAPLNLEIPPYDFVSDDIIKIG